jgi:hypothetical protein
MTKGYEKYFSVVKHGHSKLAILMIVASELETVASYTVYDSLVCFVPKAVEIFVRHVVEIIAKSRVQLLRPAYDRTVKAGCPFDDFQFLFVAHFRLLPCAGHTTPKKDVHILPHFGVVV